MYNIIIQLLTVIVIILAGVTFYKGIKIKSLNKELETAKEMYIIEEKRNKVKLFDNNQSLIFKHKKEVKYETPDSIGKHTIDF